MFDCLYSHNSKNTQRIGLKIYMEVCYDLGKESQNPLFFGVVFLAGTCGGGEERGGRGRRGSAGTPRVNIRWDHGEKNEIEDLSQCQNHKILPDFLRHRRLSKNEKR